MRFKGNGLKLKVFFDTLISIFGKNAKIVDIEKFVIAFRRLAI